MWIMVFPLELLFVLNEAITKSAFLSLVLQMVINGNKITVLLLL
jgi:hypothetical protein